MKESSSHGEKVSELQRQNEELRRVIRHMRRDIEILGNQEPASAAPPGDKVPSSTAPGYQIPADMNPESVATTDSGIGLFHVTKLIS